MKDDNSLVDLVANQPTSPSSPDAAAWLRSIESAILDALRAGAGDQIPSRLEKVGIAWPDHPRLLWLKALVLREMQTHEPALIAAERAAALAKDDPPAQALFAQLQYETGRNAATQFAVARALAPGDMALVRGHAGALAAEGDGEAALALMTAALNDHPDWIEGQTYRATLRRLAGTGARADEGFAEALRRELADTQVKVLYFAPRATQTGMNGAQVVAMNDELNVAMDDPHSVALQLLAAIRREEEERYLGWPEKLFVRLNSLLPRLVDQALRKQLPIIQRFARSKP